MFSDDRSGSSLSTGTFIREKIVKNLDYKKQLDKLSRWWKTVSSGGKDEANITGSDTCIGGFSMRL